MKKLRLLTMGLLSMMVAVIGVNAAVKGSLQAPEAHTVNDSVTAGSGAVSSSDSNKTVDITFTGLALQTVGVGDGRAAGYAWIGAKVYAPAMDLSTDYDNVKVAYVLPDGTKNYVDNFSTIEDTDGGNKSSTNAKDRFVYVYVPVDENILANLVKEKKDYVYSWVFEWDESTTQTINIIIKYEELKNVTLTAGDDGKHEPSEDLWNSTTVESIKYDVKVNSASHGSVSANPTSAGKDTKIKLTVSPNEGYRLYTLTVKDAEGNDITVTNDEFTMPDSNVTVSATFRRISTTTEDKEPEEDKDVDTDKEDTSKEENPNTLDNVGSVVAISGLSLVVAGLGIISLRKREN